ncbi:50S ribosomal protein L11 methyltransferase [Lacticaseibacillus daqingensis]|uniref:50S ribosomal protein L11 methyltransferase n=1 Tax=Lacticaseibacillus daqingensis TaxID=2486014 RepID=UPI000F7A8462|nr:50S ribosomal protein L11 methyltransferase [Lacticaseibacillus daqingensis]
MQEWQAITVETSTEAVDAVANAMMTLGAEGIQIEDAADFAQPLQAADGRLIDSATVPHRTDGAGVTGYFSATLNVVELEQDLAHLVAQLPSFGLAPGAGTITRQGVQEADWATQWKQYYHPVRITRYLTIVPAWLDYTPAQAGEQLIRLDPGMAFGTGKHPTTALMLRLLESLVRGGERMIDVGTGSGVLALAARLLGVSHVLATDVDTVAVQNAQANLALNPAVEGITVIANDLLAGLDDQAELIVANILAEVLVPLIPQVPAHLAPNGKLLLSGIFHDKRALIEQTLAANGLTVTAVWQQGDWVALVAQQAVAA